MATGRKWKVRDAKQAVQDRYDKLAELYNKGKFNKIGDLYNDLTVIRAAKSRRLFKKKKRAVAFWTWLKTKKKVKKIQFKVTKVTLLSAPEFVKIGPNEYEGTTQRVTFIGRMTYDDPVVDFGGDGDHLNVCAFLSRNEDYGF